MKRYWVFICDSIKIFYFGWKYKYHMRKLKRNFGVVEKLLSKVDNVVDVSDI